MSTRQLLDAIPVPAAAFQARAKVGAQFVGGSVGAVLRHADRVGARIVACAALGGADFAEVEFELVNRPSLHVLEHGASARACGAEISSRWNPR